MIIHVVKPGDSIYSISTTYDVPVEKIIDDNAITNTDNLVVGQSILVDRDIVIHTVKPNESVYSIASRYNVSPKDIMEVNPEIEDPYVIYPGQALKVQSRKLGTIEVNGYTYTTIKMEVLEKVLPSLTYLSIFSYEVNDDGTLDLIDDEEIIKAAKEQNVAPIMVITNKEFSSDVASEILNDPEKQKTLIENILYILDTKGYYGLNIDFEYLYPKDKEAYNEFLLKITTELEKKGYKVFTAVAPKNREDQPGTLYEAHDYETHGKLVDRVILMTYEWGYLYGPPLPVSPYNEVRRVLNYAVVAIPSEKILMGMPNYGYDWIIPWSSGDEAAIISNLDAVEIAEKNGAAIKYDPVAETPYFNYYDKDGLEHIVWFDDAKSIRQKLLLVEKYNLAGVSYWTIGRYFPQNYIILNSLYDIKKVI